MTNRRSPEQRLECQDVKQIVANAKGMLRDNAFKTKWEKVLADKCQNSVSNGAIFVLINILQ